MGIYNQLCESKDLTTKMESISKSWLFSLLCRESFDRFQIEVVIQMKIVEVLSVNQQVQHVVTLATNLKPNLYPVKSGSLKELGGFERSEQISETRNTTTICFTVYNITLIKTNTILQFNKTLHSWKDQPKKFDFSMELQSMTSP